MFALPQSWALAVNDHYPWYLLPGTVLGIRLIDDRQVTLGLSTQDEIGETHILRVLPGDQLIEGGDHDLGPRAIQFRQSACMTVPLNTEQEVMIPW